VGPDGDHSDPISSLLDSRIWIGPLQQLELVAPPSRPDFTDTGYQHWLVFTSPSSVLAFDAWMLAHAQNLFQAAYPRIAAVGAGTADQLREMPWIAPSIEIVHVEESEKASALGLIQRLIVQQSQELFSWREQSFVLVEGDQNRPTLADGLSSLGAEVQSLPVYRRTHARWNLAIRKCLQEANSHEAGLLVTSTTVTDRLISTLAELGVPLNHLVWFTQHQTIAGQLHLKTQEPIYRVRLDPRYFVGDAFDNPTPW